MTGYAKRTKQVYEKPIVAYFNYSPVMAEERATCTSSSKGPP